MLLRASSVPKSTQIQILFKMWLIQKLKSYLKL